ncbi:MAG: gamma-glutamyl-gamma-aminobutyrate hydrolase family protein, partial [Candidatus Cryptobacteroides sp.]
VNLEEVFHGVQTPVHVVADDGIFKGLDKDFPVGRYHSWVVDEGTLPECLEVTCVSDEGLVMALRHRELDVRGLQFHPESVLTPYGKRIIENWLKQ